MEFNDDAVFTYDGQTQRTRECLERLQYYALRFNEGVEKVHSADRDMVQMVQGRQLLRTYGPRFVAEWLTFTALCQEVDKEKFKVIQGEIRRLAQEMSCHAAEVLVRKKG